LGWDISKTFSFGIFSLKQKPHLDGVGGRKFTIIGDKKVEFLSGENGIYCSLPLMGGYALTPFSLNYFC
jgi:hypothetical protein